MRNIQFSNGCFYHVFNRGTDKRVIFNNTNDKTRFLEMVQRSIAHDLYGNLVEVHAYCLMDNHFHLLLKQECEGGVSVFMQRLGTAYAKYFNRSNERIGGLFENPYEAKLIETDAYLWHVFRYIHLNPLDILYKDWKKSGIKDITGALKFVYDYQWSNLRCIFEEAGGFSKKEFLRSEFKNLFEYQQFLSDWVKFGIPNQSLVSGSLAL